MPTLNMPPKRESGQVSEPETVSQRRPKDKRYCLQVDRQTKVTFNTMDAAEESGRAIKKQNPVVRVTVYDAQEHATTVIE